MSASFIRTFLYRAILFVGWLLSPFTFWNDAFINLPIAYLCANLTNALFRTKFLFLVLVYYWLTNVIGLLIMYIFGKDLLGEKKRISVIAFDLAKTLIIYSALLIIIDRTGLLKPFTK